MVCETLAVFSMPRIRKKIKIVKFQSEKTLEIEISREEQLIKIIERMEKFRCDDSDDE